MVWAGVGQTRGVSEGRLRCRVLVSGFVQGVWFRDSARQQAERLGVAGWARNLSDGRVEVVAEGEPHAVSQLVAWCRVGPIRAEVSGIEVTEEPPEGLTSFVVRR